MTWEKVGKFLETAVPHIAGLLTNPVGEGVSLITDALAGKLGVANNPDEVMKAIQTDPDAMVKIRQMEFDLEALKIKESMNETDKAAAIIQAEAASADSYVRRTRPWMLRQSFALLALTVTVGLLSLVIMATAKVSDGTIILILGFLNETVKYLTGLVTAGFLGYTRYRSVHDKRLSAGKDPAPGLVEGLLKLIKK